jgi:GR25 family glycosyltransferase involved in LPS biosynthesis
MEINFPPVFVINLEDRKDRWAEIQESFRNWPVQLERIDAVRASPGWKGCFESHKKVVQLAKDKGYPWVLVLEDDCMPCSETSFTQFSR